MNPPAAKLVLSTCPPEKAAELAQLLVEGRFAACVNVIESVRSVYMWEGKLQKDGESLLVIKTSAERSGDLISALKKAHPYEVPEIVAIDISAGHPAYLDWVAASCRPVEA